MKIIFIKRVAPPEGPKSENRNKLELKTASLYCCGAGRRWRARPLGGAVESAPPNTRNLDRAPRRTPKGTGLLQDRESPIIRPRGIGLIANFNIPKYPRG